MFGSCGHLQAEIYTSEINATDNGSGLLRILVNFIDNNDRFLVMVDVVVVAELTNVNCCTYFGAVDVFYLS
jgi:hypothetical protein